MTLTAFASLCAALADPFSDEDALLSAHGLDAISWKNERETWQAKLNADPKVLKEFTTIFGKVRRGEKVLEPIGVQDVGEEISYWESIGDGTPCPPIPQPDDETLLAIRGKPSVPALPFIEGLYSPPPSDPSAQSDTGTLVLSLKAIRDAGKDKPTLPPSSGRIARFDQRTGKPLENPVWIPDDEDAVTLPTRKP